jgi:glycosyltransferase involved in cell wall biosynthesis
LNVVFEGYRSDVDQQLAKSDLLLHLCPEEPFGLVMLEAMAARVPVLAPDRGGAGLLIEHGVTGLHFVANEAESLADALTKLCDAEPEHLNALVSAASAVLATRFSERERLRDYRHLIHDSIGDGQSTGTQMTARELRCL